MQFWSWTWRLEQLFFEDESLHFGDCLLPRNNCSRVVQLEGHHGGKVEPMSDVLLAHSITKIKVDINFLQELYVGQHDIFEPECTEIKKGNICNIKGFLASGSPIPLILEEIENNPTQF